MKYSTMTSRIPLNPVDFIHKKQDSHTYVSKDLSTNDSKDS